MAGTAAVVAGAGVASAASVDTVLAGVNPQIHHKGIRIGGHVDAVHVDRSTSVEERNEANHALHTGDIQHTYAYDMISDGR
jgi:uncharacterized protein with NAD-binding domain and iron-sulfur cluster